MHKHSKKKKKETLIAPKSTQFEAWNCSIKQFVFLLVEHLHLMLILLHATIYCTLQRKHAQKESTIYIHQSNNIKNAKGIESYIYNEANGFT